MNIKELSLPGAFVLTPERDIDDRGFFSETYNVRAFEEIAPGVQFVQDNHSLSRQVGTLRGLHFQLPPHAQGKLVRVVRGSVLDVIVDVRKGSKTYGRSEAVELSADNWKQMWVPPGFAHAFCTLQPDTEFCYKVTDYYAPKSDSGIAFNDPDLNIDWPFPDEQLFLSEKDRNLQPWRDFQSPFTFEDS